MTDQPTYIERIAIAIYRESEGKRHNQRYPDDEAYLYLGYAVLALAKGEATTSEDVHDAWSAWAIEHYPFVHRSIVPFRCLSPEVQAYDDTYRDAIHKVAREMGQGRAA